MLCGRIASITRVNTAALLVSIRSILHWMKNSGTRTRIRFALSACRAAANENELFRNIHDSKYIVWMNSSCFSPFELRATDGLCHFYRKPLRMFGVSGFRIFAHFHTIRFSASVPENLIFPPERVPFSLRSDVIRQSPRERRRAIWNAFAARWFVSSQTQKCRKHENRTAHHRYFIDLNRFEWDMDISFQT